MKTIVGNLIPCLLVLFLFFFFSEETFSQTQNSALVDSITFYNLKEEGYVEVIQRIKITNQAPEVFIKDYSLFLKSVVPENVEVKENDINYQFSLRNDIEGYVVEVNFPDTRVGKGKSREFEIIYSTSSLIKKIGEVWEIYIPKLGNDNVFNTYNIQVKVPKSFGRLTYFSENPEEIKEDNQYKILYFNKSQVEKENISLGFGNFQIFSFTLRYNLENPLEKDAKVKVAIPPDSSYQRVFYKSIKPLPQNIEIDNDGNWLATFKLKPRERIVATVTGYAQIYPEPYPLYQPSREVLINNTKENKYWETKDHQIISIAQNLKTVEDVYNFVVNSLNYSYERALKKSERLGAKQALIRNNEAVCTEFTDLFIALLRSKGIPAREVNGYAFSEDPKIKPLSLTKDVLHAWPEYWDEKNKVWVAVDPTWGKTTGGIDYFHNNDLKHFSFVFHGESSTQPLSPGSYKFGSDPSKDVFVTLGGVPELVNNKIEIKTEIVRIIPLIKYKLIIKILNNGQSAIYNERVKISFDNKVYDEEKIESILPFSIKTIEKEIPFSILGKRSPQVIIVQYHNTIKETRGVKEQMVLGTVIIVFSIITVILSYVILKMNRPGFLRYNKQR